MHWNQIEYARGEAVEVFWYHLVHRGVIVGVHVQPGRAVRYYVRTSEGVRDYVDMHVARPQQ